MTWKKLLPIGLLTLLLLAGCAPAEETLPPVEGDSMNGMLDKDEAGAYAPFLVPVEKAGDPVGIDFRGNLLTGSVRVELVDEAEQVAWQEEISIPGPFALNTVVEPDAAGDHTLRLAWDGPLQIQYTLCWQPGAVAVPAIPPLALLPGIGIILVTLGLLAYALVRRLNWGYLGLGAVGWLATVILRLVWAASTNATVYNALGQILPEETAGPVFYLYVGALVGVFEVGGVWLALRHTRLGQEVDWSRALGFSLGFGAAEALLTGALSLANVALMMASPDLFLLEELRQAAQASNLLYGLAPIVERFFIAWVHIGANVLVFYALVSQQPRWLWPAFAYKILINTATIYGQVTGIETLAKLWAMEAVIVVWGIAGWLITRWVKRRYPAEDALSPPAEGVPPDR